jgi:F-type H+-transporting ATPase subunit b
MANSIGINPITIAGQIVSFLILFYAFRKYLFGPILENLDKRAKKQQDALRAAEETIKIKEELQNNEERMKQKLAKEVAIEFAKATKAADQRRLEMIANAEKEAKEAAQKQYLVYEKRLNQREQEVKKDLANLVIMTTRKVLSEQLDQEINQQIVKKQIEKLKNLKV